MSDKNKKKRKKGKVRTRKNPDPTKYINPDTGLEVSHNYMDDIDLIGDHTFESRLKEKWRNFMTPGGLGYDIEANVKEMGPGSLDWVQDKADYAGMVPGFGNFIDIPNAAVSALRGDKEEAAWRAAAGIPLIGLGSKPAKNALKVVRKNKGSGKKWNEAVDKLREYYKGKNAPTWAANIFKETPQVFKALPSPNAATTKATKEVAEEAIGRIARLKEFGRGLLPKNWSTKTKVITGVSGGIGIGQAVVGGQNTETDSNTDKSEIPTDSLFRFKQPVPGVTPPDSLHQHTIHEMGGVIQHQGGIERPVGNGLTEYLGATHEMGGINIGDAEVENKETSINDYIYSDSLTQGNMSFADKSKEIVENGGGDQELHTLAKMQEVVASRKGIPGRDPSQADEAFMKSGGKLDSLNMGGFKKLNDGGNKNLGKSGVAENQTNVGGGYYASDDAKMVSEEAEKEDFYNRNRDILNSLGINSWQEYNPEKHAGMFQSKVNTHLTNKYDNDEELRNQLEKEGVTDVGAYIKSQGFGGEGYMAKDDKHGEYHNSITTQGEDEPADPGEEVDETIVEESIEEKEEEETKRKDSGIVDALQFLPAIAAMGDKPDYMNTPERVNAGIVVSSDVGHRNLDRVSLNADKSRLNNNLQSMIGRGSNLSTAEKSALLLGAQQGTSKITSDEIAANKDISNTEQSLNASIDIGNAERARAASTTNATNILEADNINAKNTMYVNEFNKGADAATFDRKLDATQFATSALADIYKTRLKYDANQLESESISGDSGIADRKLDFGKYGGLKKKKKR